MIALRSAAVRAPVVAGRSRSVSVKATAAPINPSIRKGEEKVGSCALSPCRQWAVVGRGKRIQELKLGTLHFAEWNSCGRCRERARYERASRGGAHAACCARDSRTLLPAATPTHAPATARRRWWTR